MFLPEQIEYPIHGSNIIIRANTGDNPCQIAERIVTAKIDTFPAEEIVALSRKLDLARGKGRMPYLAELKEVVSNEASCYHTPWWQFFDASPYAIIAVGQNSLIECRYRDLATQLSDIQQIEQDTHASSSVSDSKLGCLSLIIGGVVTAFSLRRLLTRNH